MLVRVYILIVPLSVFIRNDTSESTENSFVSLWIFLLYKSISLHPFIHPSNYPFLHSSIAPCTQLSTASRTLYPPTNMSIHPSTFLFIHTANYHSNHLPTASHLSVHSSQYQSTSSHSSSSQHYSQCYPFTAQITDHIVCIIQKRNCFLLRRLILPRQPSFSLSST